VLGDEPVPDCTVVETEPAGFIEACSNEQLHNNETGSIDFPAENELASAIWLRVVGTRGTAYPGCGFALLVP
jgi:hypothetical protein